MGMTESMRQSNLEKCFLTDLHTHILPSVDDGAANVEIAARMLCLQKYNGIDRVALTPHYYPLRESLAGFTQRRQLAYEALHSCWNALTMPEIKLGAEVRCSPKLIELDLHQLTIGQSNYLLLELPDSGVPSFFEQVIGCMISQNITPVLAHIERCAWFRNQPEQLYRSIQMGALAQVSFSALAGRGDSFALVCLEKGLAHIVSSDAHQPEDCIGFRSIKNYAEVFSWSEQFANAIWNNAALPAFSVAPVKKGLFGYR